MTLALKPVPIPRLAGAAGAAGALETSRLEHTVSHGPDPCLWLLGRFWRWQLGSATHRAQRAPSSAHRHPLGALERAGDRTGAVADPPMQWGKAHHQRFPLHLEPGGMFSSQAYVQGP